ncbi:MAG: hypothetical protein QXM02_06625 [Thermoproteota archaeon]
MSGETILRLTLLLRNYNNDSAMKKWFRDSALRIDKNRILME